MKPRRGQNPTLNMGHQPWRGAFHENEPAIGHVDRPKQRIPSKGGASIALLPSLRSSACDQLAKRGRRQGVVPRADGIPLCLPALREGGWLSTALLGREGPLPSRESPFRGLEPARGEPDCAAQEGRAGFAAKRGAGAQDLECGFIAPAPLGGMRMVRMRGGHGRAVYWPR